jgi:hypothetical protein
MAFVEAPQIYIYLARLKFSKKVGYTIWTEVGSNDELYALDTRIILFSQPTNMTDFIGATANNSNFKEIDTEILLDALRRTTTVSRRGNISYPKLLKILDRSWTSWTWKQAVFVLNAFNMLSDICITTNRLDLDELFKSDQSNGLCELLDFLTFMTREEFEDFPSFNKQSIISTTLEILSEVEQKIFVVS